MYCILLINLLSKSLAKYISNIVYKLKQRTLYIELKHSSYLIPFIEFLKLNDLAHCDQLLDIFGSDYLSKRNRFEVGYLLLNLRHNIRIIVFVTLKRESFLTSVTTLYNSAGWLEREVWDLYGIYFSGHSDLRRILTDYGFEGFPLRKDFPLTGYLEVRYDAEYKKVIQEPLQLSQEFRTFNFTSPWESK